jgi:hypothetical protein
MTFLLHFLLLLSSSYPSAADCIQVAGVVHPFFVSVTEVTQNKAEGTLEISCKFFADDFEETLRSAYKTKLDINNKKEQANFDRLIPDYISKHLVLVADGKPLKLSYVGYEKDKESVFCYFEVTGLPFVKTLQASNSLLHDFKTEQINIMHVSVNGKRQSTKLDFPAKVASFQF